LKLISGITGPTRNFGDGVVYDGFFVTNRFGVCTVDGPTIVCPAAALTSRVNALITSGVAPVGISGATTNTGLTAAQLTNNPFLIRSTTGIGTFRDTTGGRFITTSVESFYVQDDLRVTRDLQLNLGFRWDFQQLNDGKTTYLKLNNFKQNLQPLLARMLTD
jgi:hypothetical protein